MNCTKRELATERCVFLDYVTLEYVRTELARP